MAKRKLIIPGSKYHQLTTVGAYGKSDERRYQLATFRCDCGNVKDFPISYVTLGKIKSCGCAPSPTREHVEPGTLFGDTVYLRDIVNAKSGAQRRAIFRCSCGAEFESKLCHIKGGKTKSCGCFATAKLVERSYVHGHATRKNGTDTYNVYSGMIGRCENPANHKYPDYGGRGIKVCDRWRSSFANFLVDMGEKPIGKTLDRYPDVNGDYSPGNCRWATPKEQALNRRTNVFIEYNGRRQTVSEWADELGVPRGTLYSRLHKGWPPGKILFK